MEKHHYSGACYCGNVLIDLITSSKEIEMEPRACDCDFCLKHGASYVSDPAGSLKITIEKRAQVSLFRQGAKVANFIICQNCGVLTAVYAEIEGHVYGVVNSRCLDQSSLFKDALTVSPKKLPAHEKAPRWQKIWIPDVEICG